MSNQQSTRSPFDDKQFFAPPVRYQVRPRTVRDGWPRLGGAAVLLGLGGLCLVVAAAVFLSMSWQTLALPAKVCVLAAVTAALAAAAMAATGKSLRGSAETLWASTLIDLSLDSWAARRADLGGLRAVPPAAFCAAASVLLALAALAACLLARRSALRNPLVAGQLALGTAGLTASISAMVAAHAPFWCVLSGTAVVLLALAAASQPLALPIACWTWRGGAIASWFALVCAGLVRAGLDQLVPQLWHGQANELPAAIAVALLAATARPMLGSPVLRSGSLIGGLGVTACTGWAIADNYLPVAASTAIVLLALAVLALGGSDWWRSAVRPVLGASATVGLLTVLATSLAGVQLSVDLGSGAWQRHALDPLVKPTGVAIAVAPALLLLAALLAASVLHRGWLPARSMRWCVAGALPLAVGCLMNARPDVALATGAWLAATGGGCYLAARFTERGLWWLSSISLLLALQTALAADVTSAPAFAIGAAMLLLGGRTFLGRSGAGAAARQGVELGAIMLFSMAIAAIAHIFAPSASTPLVAGLAGGAALLGSGSALGADRRWWRWPAAGAITLAAWVEASARSLYLLELYTVPAGLLCLAFGIEALRRDPKLGSWFAYAPGLAVLLGPSLLLCLQEPVSWRAPVVGVALVACVLIGAGRMLQAPLVLGAAGLALLVLREVSPYAFGMPRWAGIGLAGLVLVSLGASWENRLRNLRRARHSMAAMR